MIRSSGRNQLIYHRGTISAFKAQADKVGDMHTSGSTTSPTSSGALTSRHLPSAYSSRMQSRPQLFLLARVQLCKARALTEDPAGTTKSVGPFPAVTVESPCSQKRIYHDCNSGGHQTDACTQFILAWGETVQICCMV